LSNEPKKEKNPEDTGIYKLKKKSVKKKKKRLGLKNKKKASNNTKKFSKFFSERK
jgi:hypothetical protein